MTNDEKLTEIVSASNWTFAMLIFSASASAPGLRAEMIGYLKSMIDFLRERHPDTPDDERWQEIQFENLLTLLEALPDGGDGKWSPELIIGGLNDKAA